MTRSPSSPLTPRRRGPLVVLCGRDKHRMNPHALEVITAQSREFGWELLDLRFIWGAVPDGRPPDGALVECLATSSLGRQLRKIGCPVVRLGRLPHPKDSVFPAVLPDVAASGRLAAEHFAERGFKHVGSIGRRPWSLSEPLHKAFQDRAKALGCRSHLLRLDNQPVGSAWERFERRAGDVGAWLQSIPKPLGLLAFSDEQAARMVMICEREGFMVPEDVAILGVGNAETVCEMAPVTLSSIDTATEELARQAGLLLHDMMAGEPAPAAPVMVAPSGIVTRRSTDVLAVGDTNVARAMRFMWDNLDQNLSVEDVAAAVGQPRRKLERAFRSHLKRGVNAELRRKRLERCCELLRTTRMTVSDIAPQVGFRSGDYLHASFKQAYGVTPRKYRLRHR